MNYLVGFLAALAIYAGFPWLAAVLLVCAGFPWWAAVFFAIAWGYVKK